METGSSRGIAEPLQDWVRIFLAFGTGMGARYLVT